MVKPDDADVMLDTLADGSAKVLQNAADLFAEASTLHGAGALSRALFLHQISIEECAKIEMLGAWAVSVLLGFDVNEQKLAAAFASHKAKNYTNAYMLPLGTDEKTARRDQRRDDSLKAFKQQQITFHQESNSAKNAALYVDMQKGTFAAPEERITEEMVAGITEMNEKFLGFARLKVEMMHGWRRNPSSVRELLGWFHSRLKELRSKSDDAESVMSALMEQLFARANESGYAEEMRRRRDSADT